MSSPSPTICQICDVQPQKYSCPRCNVRYCSVACYKAPVHVQCSETFYKDSVVQEMAMLSKRLPAGLVDSAGNGDNAAEIRRMYEMLKSTAEAGDADGEDDDTYGTDDEEELDSDDEQLDADLAERLKDIDLNDADAVWQRLSDAERLEFESIVHGDDIAQLVDMKEPWWTQPERTKPVLIEELPANGAAASAASDAAAAADRPGDIPAVCQRIAPFAQLSAKPAAPCVQHNVANVLAAYARTYRFFNGDHMAAPLEAAGHLLQLSGNLRCNQNFEEHALAVEAIEPDASAAERATTAGDVLALLGGERADGRSNGYVLAALSDVHRMLGAARKVAGTQSGSGGVPVDKSEVSEKDRTAGGEFSKRFQEREGVVDAELVSRGKLTASVRKLEYYLAYVKQFQ